MSTGVLGRKNHYVYLSDDTGSFLVELLDAKASAGGFGFGPPSEGLWPYPNKYMRTCLGVILGSGEADHAPVTVQLPIADPADPLWIGTTDTFTLTYGGGSYTYEVTGRRGEKRFRQNSL